MIAKRILFINPNWNTYSEAWLHRMMQYFVEQIVGVACFNPLSKYWQKTIPVFNLGSYNIRLPFFRNLNFLFINRIIRRNKFRTTFEEFIFKSNPDIIFFDEPTTGLDPIMSNVINDLIVDNSKRLGATTITITHDLDSAQRIADKIAMLYNGKIIWLGNAKNVMNSGNPFLDQFVNRRSEGPIKF